MPSPYSEEHDLFRKQVRAFAEKELAPHADEWERDRLFPNWVFKKAAELDQSNAQYPIAVAEVLVDLDRIQEADAYLAGLGQNFEHSAGIRQTRGHLANMLGRDDDAVEFFRAAQLLAPDDNAIRPSASA